MNIESFLLNSLPTGETNRHKKQDKKNKQTREIPKGSSANKWGLTKYYILSSTMVGRFGSIESGSKMQEKYISLSSYHISWLTPDDRMHGEKKKI